MRRTIAALLVFCVAGAVCHVADGNSWNRLRYNGGTVAAKVNPFDWNTTLTVTPGTLTFLFERRTFRLATADVTALSYGQEAHRRVADMVAISIVASPLALFGLLHQSKTHFVGI